MRYLRLSNGGNTMKKKCYEYVFIIILSCCALLGTPVQSLAACDGADMSGGSTCLFLGGMGTAGGSADGSNADISASNMYPYGYLTTDISTSPGANGSISCASDPVINGTTTVCTIAPDAGYHITSVSGCGGIDPGRQPNGASYSYQTGAITGNCTVTASFAVNNDPPVANPGGPYTVDLGAGVTLDGSASSDPDAGDRIVMYEWDIDYSGTFVTDYSGTSSTLSLNSSQINTLGVGSHTIALRVRDTFGSTGTATTTLTVSIPSGGASFSLGMSEGTSIIYSSPTYPRYPALYAGCASFNGDAMITYLRFDLTQIPADQKIDSIWLTGSISWLSGSPVINAYHVDDDSLGGNTYPGLTSSGFSSYNTLLASRTVTGYGAYTWDLSGYNYTGDIVDNVLTIAMTAPGQCYVGNYVLFNRDFHLDIITSSAPVDADAPTSTIAYPVNNSRIDDRSLLISGTATDGAGVGVQKVEVSTDGGSTWNLATDTSSNGSWSSWSYSWPIPPAGPVNHTVLSRAVDYRGNQEMPGTGVDVVTFRQSGAVYAWGMNYNGQLGIGSFDGIGHPTPAQAIGLSDVFSVAGGLYHAAAIKTDGTVRTWGYNGTGQLGDGTYNPRSLSSLVPGLGGVIDIAAGDLHTAAVKSDGTVWTWGHNGYGQLGDGTGIQRPSPVQAVGLTDVIAVAAGAVHTVALKSNGTVWAWGYNSNGQVGDGTTYHRYAPVKVAGLTNVVAVAAGVYHTVALKSDGTVWAWGDNGYGQIGDGISYAHLTPIKVPGISNVVAIAAGLYHTVALKSDGTVWAWGYGGYGVLGDGAGTTRPTPVQAVGLNGVTAIATKYFHTLALKSDGTIWTWGSNAYGELGRSGNPLVPGISSYSGWMDLAGGYFTSFAIRDITAPSSDITSPVDNAAVNGVSMIITGTATDGRGMGVHEVEVSSDGGSTWSAATDTSGNGSWSTWSFNWVLPADDNYTLRSRATDSAGNEEAASAGIAVIVDNTPPSTEASLVGDTYPGTQNVTLSCDDATGSGCAGTKYCLGTGCTDWADYSAVPITVSHSTDLRFYSTDNAGNSETIKSESYQIQHTVSGSSGGHGSIGCTSPVNDGSTTTCTLMPDTGYHSASATSDACGGSLSGDTYSTGAVTEDCIVSATFALNQHTLTVNINPSSTGTGTVGGSGTYGFDTSHDVTASANSGSTFTGWSEDCSGSTSPYSVTMLDRDMTCTATFADTSGPDLTVSTLSNGAWTSNDTLNISGTAIDTLSGLQSLTVDINSDLNPVAVNPDGTYSAAVNLSDGANTVTMVATDNAGNETSDTRTINYDPYAPVITIDQPADNIKTGNATIVISGSVDEYSHISAITSNSTPVTFSFDPVTGGFTSDISLLYGINTIQVDAQDLAANTASAARTVTYDNLAPALAITEPSEDITTSTSTITIRGTVSDLTIPTVTFSLDSGTPETLPVTDGQFEKTITIHTVKTYVVRVTATDEVGNSSTVTRNIIYLGDANPDTFTFDSQNGVAPGAVVTSNAITVTGIDIPSPISISGGSYSINGGTYTPSAGTVNNGDTVTVRQTASTLYHTTTTATLTIGAVSGPFSVTTRNPNNPPICGRGPLSYSGNTVSFIDASSDDGVGGTATVSVNWGDNKIDSWTLLGNISHTYAYNATYTVRQSVKDAKGFITNCDTVTVTVPAKFKVTVNTGLSSALVKVTLGGVLKAQGYTNSAGTYTSVGIVPAANYLVTVSKGSTVFDCDGSGSANNPVTVDLSTSDRTLNCTVSP